MFKIVRVVVRLKGRSAFAKLDLARFVVSQMTGNTNFPTLTALVTELGSVADALESALIAANTGDHEAVGIKEMAEAELELVIAKLCDAINGVALGDRAKLLTCGLPLRKESTRHGELVPPSGVMSKLTSTTGRVALVFTGSKGALSYNVYRSTSPAPYNWVFIGNTSKQKYNDDDNTPGTFFFYAVSAVGAAGESSKSAAAPGMAAA